MVGGCGHAARLNHVAASPLVDVEGPGGRGVPRELLGVRERADAEPVEQSGVVDDPAQRRGPARGVVVVEQQAADAVADHGGQPADRGRDHRGGAGLGLDGDQAERLVVGRYGDQGRRGVPPGELVPGRPAARTAPRRRCRGARARPASAVGFSRPVAGRAADDRHHDPRAQLGRALEQHGDRTEQDVGGLQRLDPAGEHQHQRLGRQPELAAYGGPVQRAEGGQVDAGVDHLDASGVGVVEVDQLLGLDVGVGDQHVGGLDHLVLADDPGVRLGGVAVGQRVVLDPRHGVHGVHQRHAPPVAGQRAHLAGEPVVGVHGVVVADRLRGLGAQHLAGEHAQLRGQLVLGEALERAGVDVPHGHAVGQRRPSGQQARVGRPGEDVDLDAAHRQPPGQLDDVDVHAARVADAGLVERGGVQADHRHAADRRSAILVVSRWSEYGLQPRVTAGSGQ